MRTMTGAEIRDLANRWLAESGASLQALGAFLTEFGRLQDIAFTAEKVTQRLRAQTEAAEAETQELREVVARLRSDNARCLKEREDIAAALSQFMGEVLNKLRGEPESPHTPPRPTPPAPPRTWPGGPPRP